MSSGPWGMSSGYRARIRAATGFGAGSPSDRYALREQCAYVRSGGARFETASVITCRRTASALTVAATATAKDDPEQLGRLLQRRVVRQLASLSASPACRILPRSTGDGSALRVRHACPRCPAWRGQTGGERGAGDDTRAKSSRLIRCRSVALAKSFEQACNGEADKRPYDLAGSEQQRAGSMEWRGGRASAPQSPAACYGIGRGR